MAEKIVLSRQEYLQLQVKYGLGPENRWYAGEKIGHSPTDEEAMRYFIKEGGSKNFSEHYIPADVILQNKQTT